MKIADLVGALIVLGVLLGSAGFIGVIGASLLSRARKP